MKKFLLNTHGTQKFLKSLNKIYVIVRWEGFEVKEMYFSGKCSKRGAPIVYAYDFTNEICGRYFLKEVSDVFDGWVYACVSEGKPPARVSPLRIKDAHSPFPAL